MKLKALTKCWDDRTNTVVQVGEEFEVSEDKAQSFIQLGAAIALPSESVPQSTELIEEEAIAPAPKEEAPKPTKKSRT